MKVIILGACGGMGRYVAKSISSFKEIDNLGIADLNKVDAEILASQLGSHTKGIGVDINDTEKLLSILFDYDVVLNTVGPFFKFGYKILQTSLDANCHYMDICDDWEPTERMLELNSKAKEKNLLAILGLGASPGITNLLGKIAIDNLDKAHTNLYWLESRRGPTRGHIFTKRNKCCHDSWHRANFRKSKDI